tara:strand:+ start:903 stop:1523 length:621 start_codon:yes stop_codon:yes gene_type:complete
MKIEIKKTKNPVNYKYALNLMEKRLLNINENKAKELIWILEHKDIYTAGKSYKETEILDKSIEIIKTNRGGKITYHGPGQLICYLVIDLKKRNKDIRKFITLIETSIINTLEFYKIDTFADRDNIGIWINNHNKIEKIAAIGVKVSKWIAYHGFSVNINNDLSKYKSIIPCGIKDRGVTNLKIINNQNYEAFPDKLIENLMINLNS